ncbi:hypothetical protein BX611_0157 [Lutibacter oceani]|uniref:DUF1853 family protein n=2 Tax=Lutibacter oceani TaxID=1853311 RepID=A0A3D9S2L4_9FLAO|nr:hypothetical protein BX611_0157 [Lutibacter oceani]
MDLNTKNIQLQYEGYFNTPSLWNGDKIFGLKQFKINKFPTSKFEGAIFKNLRLGKRVERFVTHELNQHQGIKILAENVQIQNGKTTVGEIDCILTANEKPVHLEIIYKFYLYDKTVGTTELEHWIGPNRKDSLVDKLTKLKEKQLPLLYNTYTSKLLEKLNLKSKNIEQQVCFKAQLFVPLELINSSFNEINNECIKGFYIHFEKLKQLADCKFYIPSKINWLQEVQTHVKWISYTRFYTKIEEIIKEETAPLCWIKYPNGTMQKLFVVWWK